jgi:chromosome segregation ATPase
MSDDPRPHLNAEIFNLDRSIARIMGPLVAVRQELQAAEAKYDEWSESAPSQKATIGVLRDRVASLEKQLVGLENQRATLERQVQAIADAVAEVEEFNATSDRIDELKRRTVHALRVIDAELNTLRQMSTGALYDTSASPGNQRRLQDFARAGLILNAKERLAGRANHLVPFLSLEVWQQPSPYSELRLPEED